MQERFLIAHVTARYKAVSISFCSMWWFRDPGVFFLWSCKMGTSVLHQVPCLQLADEGWRKSGDHVGDFLGRKAWEWHIPLLLTCVGQISVMWPQVVLGHGFKRERERYLVITWHSHCHSWSDVSLWRNRKRFSNTCKMLEILSEI